MRGTQTERADRRAWLVTSLRGAACVALAGTLGLLAARGQVRGCPRGGLPCGGCPELAACALPPAAAARRRRAQQGEG